MPPASSSTVWRPAAGAADRVEAEVGGRRAHRAGPDLRARAAEGSDAAVVGSDAAVSDAGVAGRAPGHGPDVRRRRECRGRPARLGVSVRIGDPSPGPPAAACAPGVPAGTRSRPPAPPTRRAPGRAIAVCHRRRPGPRAPGRHAPRRSRGNAITVCPQRRPGRRAPGRSRGNAITVCPQCRPGRRALPGNATTVCPQCRPGRRALPGNATTVRPRLRPGRCAHGRSRGNVPPFPQRLRVHVQHHLIPVAGRPPVESARQRRLRHRSDGVRLPLRERRLFRAGRGAGRLGGGFPVPARRRAGGFLLRARRRAGGFPFPAAVRRRRAPRLVACRLQRPPQHRPHLRRQPPPDNHHPVLVHPRPQFAARVLPPLLRLLHVPVDAPPRPRDPFHVRRRARQRNIEQGLLVRRRGHPRDRAHLRVGDLAAAHGVAQLRQLPEGARHADVLAGRPQREPGPPAQPLGAREATVPAVPLVELADEHEQLVGGGLDAGGQLGDAVAEPREPRAAVGGSRRAVGGRRLVGPAVAASVGSRAAVAGRSRRLTGRRPVGGLDIGPAVAASVGSRATLAGSRRGVGGGDSSGSPTEAGGYVRDVDGAGPFSADMNHCNPLYLNGLQ